MPYTHVQFIAFEVPTLYAFPTGTLIYGQPHFTQINDQRQDAEMRAKCIFDAIEWCLNNGADASEQTLKVFVAPEFYFRYYLGQSDGSNHYDRGMVRDVIENLINQCKHYRHWFIVPGTAVVRDTDIKAGVGLNEQVTFNCTYAFLAGTDIKAVILKEMYSGIDNMEQAKNAQKSYSNILAALQNSTSTVSIPGGSARRSSGDLLIGLEICLDHALKRLSDNTTGMGKLEPYLDIHILSACGMPTQNPSLAARRDGYFCRCDGSQGFLGSEMARVTSWSPSPFTAQTTPIPAASVNEPPALQINYGARMVNPHQYGNSPCRISIYPSQPL
jgi:hypothetical protein